MWPRSAHMTKSTRKYLGRVVAGGLVALAVASGAGSLVTDGTAVVTEGTARAGRLDAAAGVLGTGRADPRDGQLHSMVPVYQTVSLLWREIRNPYFQDLKLVLTGWGEVTLGDPRNERGTGDLDAAFVEGGLLKHRIDFRVGR